MTLGEWLNQMILEDTAEPAVAARRLASTSPQALSSHFPPAPSPRTETPRVDRLEAPNAREDELERVVGAMERLTARIEQAEHRSTLAISGIDQSVLGVLSRMETAEREQAQVAARFEGAIDELRTDHARAAERLRRLEQEAGGHRSAEAMRALEGALNKVAGQLYDGEARTRETIGVIRRDLDQLTHKAASSEAGSQALVEAVVSRIADRLERAEAGTSQAIRNLETSFASLDNRLSGAEAQVEQRAAEPRLEQLASELSQKVEQTRLDMAEQIRATAEGRFDKLERSLREMTDHVQLAERRSAQAIEKMGQEVLHMAQSFNQKVQASESRGAEALDQIGAEVQRVANTVEQKLRRADGSQAEALEKLGAEIARITERLAERIANAERRSAHAIDDVGEQMARVTERINQRQDRASSELQERMRQSEERTARLLEGARDRIDRRLEETHKAESTPPPAAAPPAPAVQAPTAGASAADPFAGTHFAEDYDPFGAPPFPDSGYSSSPAPAHHGEPSVADVFAAPADYQAETFPTEPDGPAFSPADFDNAQAYSQGNAYSSEPAYSQGTAGYAPEPHEEAPTAEAGLETASTRSASTQELIAAARAAARRASQAPEKDKARQGGGPLSRFGKRKEGGAVRNALLASGAVALLGMSAAGYVLYRADLVAGWSQSGSSDKAGETAAAAAPAPTASPASNEALAANLTTDVAPTPGTDVLSTPAPASDADDTSALYNQAKDKIKANDPSGVETMRKAANLGYAPAQFYLAKLYEDGTAGVKKDMAEARRWTERAATGGDPKAMHNLGLYYFHGDGGAKSVTTAASWFRRAADLGLVDSQYNLAQLYEQGLGVTQNPAEAYKWFLIASKSGDAESKASSQRLKPQLSASAQQAAERAASAFRAESVDSNQATATAAATAAPAEGIADRALAQMALSKLGYYKGPDDGANSPALRLAIASYQKTLGQTADGGLTPDLIEKFKAISTKSDFPG